jgi:hypothetical protein
MANIAKNSESVSRYNMSSDRKNYLLLSIYVLKTIEQKFSPELRYLGPAWSL